jgi:imidazole glycerol-phosphate synthase subunit HisF
MIRPRIIPCLLVDNGRLVKTVEFRRPTYVGDPINAIRVFNDKGADELVLLDIAATPEGREPDFELLEKVATECFMPLCYGGGVTSLEQMRRLLGLGIEKVAVNTSAVERPDLVREAAAEFGSQSVVVSIDVKRRRRGSFEVVTRSAKARTGLDPVGAAQEAEQLGAGELLLTSVERDGSMRGYDLDLIRRVAGAVGIPVVASGGAATGRDLVSAIADGGASGAAAGSMFVFTGRHRAVLISYLTADDLTDEFVLAGGGRA